MARMAERSKLRFANRWVDLHAATAESGVEVCNAGALDCEVPIGGPGTTAMAAFTAEPFGAALGISTISAMHLISVAVELKHRLPQVWALLEALDVAAWKPKMVARITSALSVEAAAYVDAELAPILATRGGPTIERVVREAIARFHPEKVTEAEQVGKAAWDVRIQHPGVGEWAGTTWLDACGDSVDLTKFGDLVADIARRLGEAGDLDSLEQRRAKAFGVVADVHAGADLDELIAVLVTPAAGQEPVRRPRIRARDLQLYIHLAAEDLEGGIATVEGLGAVTVARIEDWLARHTAAGGRVRVTPVVDPARDDAVDRHDPPAWMAEQVRLTDPLCVFPYCQTSARDCDLDHVVPYDDTGPPGQTNPQNLAPLCRRHHRAKTAKRWRYERNPDGSHAWTSPQDDRYLVRHGGTLALTDH
jgi:hypothetical protein